MSEPQTVKVENYPSYEVQLRRLLRTIADQDAEIQRLKEELYDLREALYGG